MSCQKSNIQYIRRFPFRAIVRRGALLVVAAPLVWCAPALGDPTFAPSFFDPHARPTKPDLGNLHSLRFLTDSDYPPFHFEMPDGALAGFDIDLARAICETLKLSCTIQARRFDTLVDALKADEGDAIIASLRIDAKARETLDFTVPYAKNPARFVRLRQTQLGEASPETLRGKFIGVVAKTAHEAYLDAYFKGSTRKTFDSQTALTDALKNGDVDVIFGDGAALSVWLQGPARDCCAFSGGSFLESHFFGDGVGIALKKDNPALRQALDYALADLWARGVYTDLYLKYFPLGFY
ncbi:extracellular solute-binding protein family 3 [Methylocella silvestris BL2]|uniref:Extracellular solute-binding protein family 3 n=1 Tax=Methylocella silvestris (strain DSM 15510 / CIP 108128 / LMG 27833 / NCIMB 13906 / BL2) TaxID=395965 RepID=B8EKQ5_METSB|nr:transporter substrate-binding domain-containing protein [Methylocella silvestris]ACK51933.1 extracellular solute-binding protein family 3 [Methylocella silvestris BL2]